jgi:hypothetical protein
VLAADCFTNIDVVGGTVVLIIGISLKGSLDTCKMEPSHRVHSTGCSCLVRM